MSTQTTPCQTRDPDIWFSFDPDTQHYAASLCRECPVRQECLRVALEYERGHSVSFRFGIWGGKTPEQRARIRRLKEVA